VVVGVTTTGLGCGGGIGAGAVVVGVTGEGTGALLGVGITAGETAICTAGEAAIGTAGKTVIGTMAGACAPEPLRCTDPPDDAMGVKRTPTATSAAPAPKRTAGFLRTPTPFITPFRPIGGCRRSGSSNAESLGLVFRLVLSL
jgi:hypothetical protein